MEKPILYFISGLGADHRAYMFLNFEEYECKYIQWVEHDDRDTLSDYAKKLLTQFDTTKPIIIIATSLGGMIAAEINKLIKVKHTFLISTIKSKAEQPSYFKLFRRLPAHQLIPDKVLGNPNFWMKFLFPAGVKPEWKKLFFDMFSNWSPSFLRWAMNAALHWNNTEIIQNYTHIHGDRDIVFPIRYVKNYQLIKNGTHVMVLSRAREIRTIIISQLSISQ